MRWNSIPTKPKILSAVAIPMMLLLALGSIAIFSMSKIQTTAGWVNHTYNVLSEADDILASAVDMETGMRGYLLAGKEDFLDPYRAGESATYKRIAALQETVSDNPGQVERLAEIEKVLREWQANVTEPAIELRRRIGDAQTMNDMASLVGEARGKTYFDKFREQIALFIAREQELLAKRSAEFDALLAGGQIERDAVENTIGWVSHTYKVISQAKDIVAAAVDMETGMRGYLLAGKEEFLQPYASGTTRFFELTGALKQTVSDNPAQVELLGEAEKTIEAWRQQVTEPMIGLRREIGNAKTMDDMADRVGEARGKVYFDHFRELMAEFSAEEASLMEVRKAENESTRSTTRNILLGGMLLALLLGGGAGWLIGSGIAGPITRMTGAMGRLAEGDKGVEIPGVERGDEVGEMAQAVQVFKTKMIEADELAAREEEQARARQERAETIEKLTAGFDTNVSSLLQNVSGSADEMESTARTMSEIASETNARATTVASAAEQASVNVQTVAASADELSSSIKEIGRQMTQSSQIASQAVAEADKTDKQVQALAAAANEINEVVKLISDIAEQTNLLALNATIEAARAGEAGKGFAVVASEVKSLASETSKATDTISQRINGVQAETESAVQAIRSISNVVGEIDQIAATISAAVEEQSAATDEIARNVEQASGGTSEVSSNILQVTNAAGEAGETSGKVAEVARGLNENTAGLRAEIERFLSGVKAA